MGQIRRFRLDNGLRVVLETRAESRAVALTLGLCRGSRSEPEQLGGATHFAEHLLFKGTSRLDLHALAREMNLQGGGMNAVTSTDSLRLYTNVVVDDMEPALALMRAMIWDSQFPEQEVERERGVILEEIAEYQDSPEDLCFDTFLLKFWMPHPAGRPVLGTPENIARFTRCDLLDYWESICTPDRFVLSIAGGMDMDSTESLVRRLLGDLPARVPRADAGAAPAVANPGRVAIARDLEQVQFCIGLPAVHVRDDRRFALSLFDLILGGGMGSRLFTEIREKRGLAYSISSSLTLLDQEGYIVMYGGTSPDHADEVVRLCREELLKLATEGPGEEELQTAIRQSVRALLLAQESNGFRAGRNADREQFGIPYLTDDELAERLRNVTREDILAAARDLFLGRDFTVSLVGPVANADASFETNGIAGAAHHRETAG